MRSAAQRVACAVALCVAALAMQSFGLLHGYVHPHDSHPRLADVDTHTSATTAPHPPTEAPDTLPAVFAGHDAQSAGCTLFDQLTHADLLVSSPLQALAFAAPGQPDAFHAAWHHATQSTGFLARAPPATLG